MADVHDKETRSYNMSRIKGVNTRPEMLVRKYLHGQGFRYTLHNKNFPGKPDLVLPKHKTVIFVNGCFWHGHEDCKYFVIPKTRREWWLKKIQSAIIRDSKNIQDIKNEGWNVSVIWECELKKDKRILSTLPNRILDGY